MKTDMQDLSAGVPMNENGLDVCCKRALQAYALFEEQAMSLLEE